ncbi:hypothetical protein [Streptomyces roseoverticillatus]|uniref:Secreted protein n=1 Tax=Streptomyces roseoverticillatus TaxID=66429 RepID=A0ABV3IT47_9ACTN
MLTFSKLGRTGRTVAAGAAALGLATLGMAGTASAATSAPSAAPASCDLGAGRPYIDNPSGRVWVNGRANNCGGAWDKVCVWLIRGALNPRGGILEYTQDIQCTDVDEYTGTWPATSNYGPGMWIGTVHAYKNGQEVKVVKGEATWL